MPQSWRVAIEGNIGVGKSTLLPELADKMGADWNILTERVDEDPEFKQRLADFYEDSNKQVQLQSWITKRRESDFQKLEINKNYLLERSFLGELVFCHANLMRHECPDGAYISYYYNIIKAAKECRYDALIYLQASPEVCYARICNRSRGAEEKMDFSYVDYLHRCYEAHLPEVARNLGVPFIIVDWQDFGDVSMVADKLQKTLAKQTPKLQVA